MKSKTDELYELDGIVRTTEEKIELIIKKNMDIGLFNVSDFIEKLWHNYKILKDRDEIKKFDFEQWLREQTDWEDTDSALSFHVTEHDQIIISDLNDNRYVMGKILQEACEKWSKKKQKI